MTKLRYSEFVDRIDIDAFEAAVDFEVIRTDRDNDIGHCLFPENHSHGDSTGKFAIHREKRVYNCWVCGGGSLLSLAMELFDFDVDTATTWLYEFAHGDQRDDDEFADYLMALLDDVHERVETMPYFNQRVLERFDGPTDYFLERGISPEVIERYHLCYGENVVKPAPVKQTANGPTKIDEDYCGPAAIFPHYWEGRLVGWQHRWIEYGNGTPKWLAKYTNTTDFPKHLTLFNYDQAIQAHDPVMVLESVPSSLFLVSNGIPAVSFFGNGKLSDMQLRLLRRFSQGIILAPDNDPTGDLFVRTTAEKLERFIPIWYTEKVELAEKADLGDYATTDDPKANLRDHLETRTHMVGLEI